MIRVRHRLRRRRHLLHPLPRRPLHRGHRLRAHALHAGARASARRLRPGARPGRFLEDLLLRGTDPLSFEVRIHEVMPRRGAIRRDGATLDALGHRATASRSVGWVARRGRRGPDGFHPERARERRRARRESRGASCSAGAAVTLPAAGWSRPAAIVDAPRRGRTRGRHRRHAPLRGRRGGGPRRPTSSSTSAPSATARRPRAVETTHSTGARGRPRGAPRPGVRRLVLTHLSTRYDADPSLAARPRPREEFPRGRRGGPATALAPVELP